MTTQSLSRGATVLSKFICSRMPRRGIGRELWDCIRRILPVQSVDNPPLATMRQQDPNTRILIPLISIYLGLDNSPEACVRHSIALPTFWRSLPHMSTPLNSMYLLHSGSSSNCFTNSASNVICSSTPSSSPAPPGPLCGG